MVIEGAVIRGVLAFARRYWPLLIVGAALFAVWLMAQRMQGMEARIVAQQSTIAAKELQIKAQAASIEQARLVAQQRAEDAQRAIQEAMEQGAAHQREIDRLRRFKPATGDDCKDAAVRLQDYRNRKRVRS